MRLNTLVWGSASALVLIALAATSPALAQEAATTDDAVSVGDIIVTAQKREQRLQDVPVTVTVATKQLLDDAGVDDIKDLQLLTPGLTVTSTTTEGSTTARIRGIGTVGDNPGLESSVGIVIDGVYRPRNGVSFGDLGQVSRIEVLKGPQGTLFGKNNSAGVINIVTEQPSFTYGHEAELTVGDYAARGGSLYITGPLVGDSLAGSFYAVSRSRDGFLDVTTPSGVAGADQRNHEANDEDYHSLRGQLLLDLNSRVSARIIADYSKREEDCCLATQLYVGTQAGNPALMLENPDRQKAPGIILNELRAGTLDATNTPFDRLAYANRASNQHITDKGLSAQIDFDLDDDMTLTSITAMREWKNAFSMEADFTAADLLYRPDDGTNYNKFTQLSQELRLAGVSGPINWLVGAFAAKEDLDSGQALLTGADMYSFLVTRSLSSVPMAAGITSANSLQAGSGTIDTHRQEGRTYALFANADYAVTDRLTVTGGLRYTQDEKTLNSVYRTTGGTCQRAQAGYANIRAAITPLTATATRSIVANTIVSKLCSNQYNAAFDALSAAGPHRQESDEDNVSGTVKAAFRFNDVVMTYASYARGYKAGGFNLDRAPLVTGAPSTTASQVFGANPDTSFGAETAESYEIGAKLQFSRDFLVNAAVFSQEFTDFQYNTFAGTSFVVTTLPKVTTDGVDLDIYYKTPIAGLSLQGGLTYADTKIGDFAPLASGYPPVVGPSFNRLPNGTLSFSPKVSASLAVTHVMPVFEGWELRSNLSGKYTSEYNTGSDLNPIKQQDAFTLFNARIALARTDDLVSIELWSQNLLDEDYIQVGFNGPYQAGDAGTSTNEQNDAVSVYDAFLGAPRTVGLTLRSKF
jgi:outer membrane receptor protein involved in Fe transport